MKLEEQLRPLLAQYSTATGRGNMIQANSMIMQIIQQMAHRIDQPCACCQGTPVKEQSEWFPEVLSAADILPPIPAKPKRKRVSRKPVKKAVVT